MKVKFFKNEFPDTCKLACHVMGLTDGNCDITKIDEPQKVVQKTDSTVIKATNLGEVWSEQICVGCSLDLNNL